MSLDPQKVAAYDVEVFAQALRGDRGPDQQRIAVEGLNFIQTLLKKNADYGSSVWEPPVLAPNMSRGDSILVRMSDKVKRIQTIQRNGKAEISSEALEDSIRDLAAYGLLYLCRPQENPPS